MNNKYLNELNLDIYPSIEDVEILSKILDYKNTKLNPNEFLNMRQDAQGLAQYESGKTSASTIIGKDIST